MAIDALYTDHHDGATIIDCTCPPMTDWLPLVIRRKGFEDELSRQRADSERIKSEKNEKIDRLQTELDQATDKIGELQDDVDQKQLEGSRSK